MKQVSKELVVHTHGRELLEITTHINEWLRQNSLQEGILNIFIKHTSASLTIQENADPDVLVDLLFYFEQLVEDAHPEFRHRAEGPDDMSAHIRSALTDVSLTIPVMNGALNLGTWQGVYVFEHRTSLIHGGLS
ncbi:secondary thiamine-phosphate synthase enzyme YjbQ [Sneathiella glossodoripedis]|uniref:secondary thiamine-phosphate synthase enzyme YjbQ n=1 Tax=Sneathiella glossodoripedis TaxID=418853 RepID=UPI000A7D9EB3|nr:secondary thiamine-phosphate synthase enzyme YjbQ [Sneathiella glossodoripedis]